MKNETKKLLFGLGIGCAVGSLGLLLGIGVYGCASKPVTTTPIVRNIKIQQQPKNVAVNNDPFNIMYVTAQNLRGWSVVVDGNGNLQKSWNNDNAGFLVLSDVAYPSLYEGGYFWFKGNKEVQGWNTFYLTNSLDVLDFSNTYVLCSLGDNQNGEGFSSGEWVRVPSGYHYLVYSGYILEYYNQTGQYLPDHYQPVVYDMANIDSLSSVNLPEMWYPWAVSGGNGNEKGSPLFLPKNGDTRFDIPQGEADSLHVVTIDVPLSRFMFKYDNVYGTQIGVADKMRFRFRSWHNGNIGYWKNGQWVGADIPSGYWLLYQVDYIEAFNADNSQNGSSYNAWLMPEEYPSPVSGKTCYKYLESGFSSGGYRNITMLYSNADKYDPIGEGVYKDAMDWLIWLSQRDMSGFLPAAVDDVTGGVDVFGLISSTFYAVMPILAIQILPGFTLGLLFLLPIVATIIILVFKAIKK